jgi:Interferon-induced transmembrane protein
MKEGGAMSEGWLPGEAPPAGEGQAVPTWQPTEQSALKVRAYWVLAVISLFLFWPLAIAEFIFAARVKPALMAGDVAGARNASKRVVLLFWISVAVFMLWLIIVALVAIQVNSSPGSSAS